MAPENNNAIVLREETLRSLIYTVRGVQVMLDSDLAELYGVESRRLNEQVKRNIERFPESFRFQLTQAEYDSLMSQFATLEATPDLRSHNKKLRTSIATSVIDQAALEALEPVITIDEVELFRSKETGGYY